MKKKLGFNIWLNLKNWFFQNQVTLNGAVNSLMSRADISQFPCREIKLIDKNKTL